MDMVELRRNYLGIHRFSEHIIDVMRNTDRAMFAPPDTEHIYEDDPVPIACGQTCSQPSMVAAMADFLQLEPGHKILEVGTGCGYSAAITAQLIRPGGILHTVEYISELSHSARKNLSKLRIIDNIRFVTGDGSIGLPDEAPFDRIYLTAGVGRCFNEQILLDQLAPEGILVYPEAHGSMYILKQTATGVDKQTLGGVGFVFLRGVNSGFG